MDRVSLTYFVDFVMKSGMPKLNVVRDFKERDKYEPFADFYKQAREALVEAHKGPLPKKALDRFLVAVKEEKRRKVYPSVIKGHKRFLGNRAVTWFQPPTTVWKINGMDININPELGLMIDDVPHVIKLYFKESPLVANRVSSIAHLMTVALAPHAPGSVFGLLDMRRSKLHMLRAPNPSLHALLEGEAAAFAAMHVALELPGKNLRLAKTEPAIAAPQNVVVMPVAPRGLEARAEGGAQ